MAKKTNRVKSDNVIIGIKSWEQADDMIRQIGEGLLTIQTAEAEANEKINAVKAALATAVKPFKETISLYTESLQAFAATRRDDFVGKRRSKDLTFGTLGWRLSKSIRIKKDATLELIKQVFKRRAKQYIHINETPDKDALAKLTDETLAAVKARRIVKDDFFVEPKLPEAVDYPESK